MDDPIVPPIKNQPCSMKGHQAKSCPVHNPGKVFLYRTRQAKAEQWFQKTHGWDSETAAFRAQGIDFNRPVGFKTLKKGKVIEQWVRKGGKAGLDFTEPNANPKTLGIPIDPKSGLPAERTLVRFQVEKDIKVMRCWTGDMPETAEKLIGGKGGSPQLTMPPGWENSIKMIN